MRIVFALVIAVLGFAGQAAAQALPAEVSTSCKLDQVAVFENRVHVRCQLYQTYREGSGAEHIVQSYKNPIDERIIYFAVAADTPLAGRVAALAEKASPNDEVTILFRTSAAENPTGCLADDCRKLTGLVLPIPH